MPKMSLQRYWFEIIMFIVCGFVAIGVSILPMSLTPSSSAFPDLLFPVVIAWVIRHPTTAPIFLVVMLGILADVMMMRPIGLWALMLLMSSEAIRLAERTFRDIPFLLEWFYVGALFTILMLLQNLLLFISFSSLYDAGDIVIHIVFSVAFYPLIVLVLRWMVGIRRPQKNTRPNRLGYVL